MVVVFFISFLHQCNQALWCSGTKIKRLKLHRLNAVHWLSSSIFCLLAALLICCTCCPNLVEEQISNCLLKKKLVWVLLKRPHVVYVKQDRLFLLWLACYVHCVWTINNLFRDNLMGISSWLFKAIQAPI